MRTINQSALNKSKFTTDDFNPLIGVSGNQLLTTTSPNFSGTFTHAGALNDGAYVLDSLPAIRAGSFRVTNSSDQEAEVVQKVIYFSRYFDESTLGVSPDSTSVSFSGVIDQTPMGTSQVLKIEHKADTSLHMSVPTPANIGTLNYQVYFKVIDLTSEIQPIGIYNRSAGIDINYPAAAIRILPDGSIQARYGYTSETPTNQTAVVVGAWYRANIQITGNTFSISVDKYEAGLYVPSITDSGNRSSSYTSIGASLLDETYNDDSHALAFAAEGRAEVYMENLEVFVSTNQAEVLQAGETKKYYVRTSLDEVAIKGPVSGYYMS